MEKSKPKAASGRKTTACLVLSVKSLVLDLAPILKIFEKTRTQAIHIESRKSRTCENEFEIYVEVEMESSGGLNSLVDSLKTKVDNVKILNTSNNNADKLKKLTSLDRGDTKYTADGFPWFPKTIADLDQCANRVLMYGTELDADHPGFKDEAYRKRRVEFAEIAYNYRYGQPIPRVEYNETEKKTWSTIYQELIKLYPTHACKEYLQNFPALEKHCGYSQDNLPQLQDISKYLKEKTGFSLRPVAGYLSSRDFLAGLAFRVFHCTQYIRHGSDPFYTPEPDCCHELLGHMPLFLDPSFAEFSQEIGLVSLGASDEDIQRLATCYFFTIEFGLCRQNGEFRVFGAGLLSSIGELKHVLSDAAVRKPFDPDVVCETESLITTFQSVYFYTETLEDAKAKLKNFARTIKRPFELTYDPYTQTVHVLDQPKAIAKSLGDLQSQLITVTSAVRKLEA